MKKIVFSIFCFIFFLVSAGAQLQSPETFLGYKIGTRYTPHYRIVDYFKHVASQSASTVKLQQYGETNEGRPLYLTFVGSEQNISNLEKIRINNLNMAKQGNGNPASPHENPVIVWLSYNVHGNETSSSEAALLTLYDLANPNNTQSKQWLKNTLVIIDPCLNPDGRDRYVNWYTSVIGAKYNPQPNAREHAEPWPGGRSNHYYFDLNRDWAWQTQTESRQRVTQYNQWLPQIHVDFHEQGYNSPYFFAPAAEPYHEVITPWQREFQKIIGKNHARYFDKNGWLYFTNERFDLFYPSYGDTYPIYNGSIGMTYEQGGIRAGLGIITAEGDTLTLGDRVLHHFTTSLSTIESAAQNSNKLILEFKKYFTEDRSGVFKSYVIKNKPQDRQRLQALFNFFDRNNISYTNATGNTVAKGYDYFTGKTVSFTISGEDYIVSATQPKRALVRVLFDPNPKLTDSITYDITSWALPYVYGLTTYACTQKINLSNSSPVMAKVQNAAKEAYGYLIAWEGVASAKIVADLLQQGIRVRHSEVPTVVNGQQYPAGSLLVLKTGNEKFGAGLWEKLNRTCNENHIEMVELRSGLVEKGVDFGSSKVVVNDAPRIVLLTGKQISSTSVGDVWHFLDKELQYPVTLIDAENIHQANWNSFDVLILVEGFYPFLNESSAADKLAAWISNGGKVIAMENAVNQLTRQKWSTLKIKDTESKTDSLLKKDLYSALKGYDDREREAVLRSTPGSVLKVELDNTHPLMFGYPTVYYTLKTDNNLFEFIKERGWNAGVIKKESQLSGFVGSLFKEKLKDGLVFGSQDLGRGSVIYLTDNVLFRNFWENGKLMFCNALFQCKTGQKLF